MKKITLKNGLRILLVPKSGSVTATVLVLVAAGSEYEKKQVNGLSHFLEHMVFKGTEARPRPGMIAQELDALGSEYNAFTSQEYTGYWAKAEYRKTARLLELVSDLYLHPVFDPREIEKERGVIIEEINMYEDMPMRSVHDIFLELLYGDQPAGWSVAGRKEVIRRLTKNDFRTYRNAHYVTEGTLVIVAGKFNEERVVRQVKELFSVLPRKKSPRKPKTKAMQSTPRAKVKYKKSDQTHLVLGMQAFPLYDPRRYSLNLLAHLLGGGMSSRLFYRVREELGAAYYIRADAELLIDHGYLAISAGVNHSKMDAVIEVILEECARLTEEKVDEKELRRTKDHLIGTFLLGLETSDSLANFYAGQELLLGKAISPEDTVKNVERVTPDKLREVAKAVFQERGMNLAVVGPYRSAQAFRKKLRFPKR